MALIAMTEAASRLGVSVRQVQRLVKSGDLDRVGANRLELESVLRYERSIAGHRRQAWSEATAWGAIGLLSGVKVDWLGQAQKSRLKARLHSMTAEEFVGSVRNRARVYRFTAHSSTVSRVEAQLITSGSKQALAGLTVAANEKADGYVDSANVDRLVGTYLLSTDNVGDAEIVLRATSMDLDVVKAIAGVAEVLAASDLATSLDTRERSAGLRVISHQLPQFS